MMNWDDRLAAEDAAVALLAKAREGVIIPGLFLMTLRADGHKVVLRVWVDDVEEAADRVKQLVGELQMQLDEAGGEVSPELFQSTEAPPDGQPGRVVYLRSGQQWGAGVSGENVAVLMVVQAMAGGIGPDWAAITVRVEGHLVMLRVWVDDIEAAGEDVDYLVFELEALALGDGREVRIELSGGTPSPACRQQAGRLVYLRRECPRAPEGDRHPLLRMHWDDPFAAENVAVLMVVQAMAGLIGPDWDAITLRIDGHMVLLGVWVDDAQAATVAVAELVDGLREQLYGQEGEVSLELSEGTPRPLNPHQRDRLVYLRPLLHRPRRTVIRLT